MPDEAGEPIIYLDVNVILDSVDARRPAASVLLDRIRENSWSAITSPFSILEMLEAKKSDKWAEILLGRGMSFFQVQRRLGERRTGQSRLSRQSLNEVYQDLQAKLQPISEFVTFPAPSSSLMNRAEDISAATNIEATDVFHLATAIEFGCDILVSGDNDFIKLAQGYIIAVLPDRFERGLEEFHHRRLTVQGC